MKNILVIGMLSIIITGKAQTCDCEKEFLNIKKTIEQNFSGFSDRVKIIGKETYGKQVNELYKLTHDKFASDNCILIINKYLGIFKSHHLGFSINFDPLKIDTNYANYRPLFPITDYQIDRLKTSKTWEGIYNFTHDTSYKIAVVKDPTPLHDYVGVIIESKVPSWKRGMIKLEGKLVNDSLITGLLYIRNHYPKLEGFSLWDDNNKRLSGDWLRDGEVKTKLIWSTSTKKHYSTIDAEKLTSNTMYIRIGSFGSDYTKKIDSVLKANDSILNSTPNLILDLTKNGGGTDDSWIGLIPYLYTQPIKSIGADLLASETTILAYKKLVEDTGMPKQKVDYFNNKIKKMEQAKGQWITGNKDEIDSSYTTKAFPKKVLILINNECGSSTEEFLLAAKQSSKVILAGENTIGNLDYSNVVRVPFWCYPYTLLYATTRSRRLNINQGIDNVGIAPQYHLSESDDWIKEALKILER